MISYEGNRAWSEFENEVKEQLKLHVALKTYFFATGCGLDSYNFSRRKLIAFSGQHPDFKFVEEKREPHVVPSMALVTFISSVADLNSKWEKVMRLSAKCGCSIFLSDGQEIEISIIEPDHVLAIEGR